MRTVGMWCNRIWFIAARQQEKTTTQLSCQVLTQLLPDPNHCKEVCDCDITFFHPSQEELRGKKSLTHPSSMWKNLICPNFPTSLCWCCRKHRGSYSGVLITCPVLYVRSCCAALNSLNTHTALHHCHQDGFLHSTTLTMYRWLSFSSWPTDNPHCAC